MVKRRKQKKAAKKQKQNQKQKQKQLSNLKPSHGLKISQAILNLCEPLIRRYQERYQIECIISMTVTAWNLSLLPAAERAYQTEEIIVKRIPKQIVGEDIAFFMENLDALIELKKKYYPSIRDYILEYDVSFSGDSFTLVVCVTTLPEKIRKKRPPI